MQKDIIIEEWEWVKLINNDSLLPWCGTQEFRTQLAALYSATKLLQNSCTAKLQMLSSILEAKQQLNSSCHGMQKRCAAFEALGSSFAAQLPTFKASEVAAVRLQNQLHAVDLIGYNFLECQ